MKNLLKSNLVIEDKEHYYLFRSLNAGDRDDLEQDITAILDESGKPVYDDKARKVISRIRTDRERFVEKGSKEPPKYKMENEEKCSLEEVYDHIRIHQRKDTNCISLSANSNVTFTYYANENPQYVVVKLRKDDEQLLNASEYMLDEMSKAVNEIIGEINNPLALDLLVRIKESKSTEQVLQLVKEHESEIIRIKRENEYGDYNEIKFDVGIFSEISYLNQEQNLEITKLIALIQVLKDFEFLENFNSRGRTNSINLISTMKSALSSSEYIHYGEIKGEDVIRISKENLQVISILQQYKDIKPENSDIIDEIIFKVLEKNEVGENVIDSIEEYEEIQHLPIAEILEMTEGRIPYKEATEQIKAFINIARGRNDAIKLISSLEKEFTNYEIFEEMKKVCILANPNIVNKQNGKGVKVCESVNLTSGLDSEKLEEILHIVQGFEDEELQEYILGEKRRVFDISEGLTPRQRIVPEAIGTASNKYFAEAICDCYDWNRKSPRRIEKNKIIKKIFAPGSKVLRGNSIERLYNSFEKVGISRNEISGVFINLAITGKLGDVSYLELVESENQEQLIRDNIDNIESLVDPIDIELLLGKDKLVVKELKKLGVRESFFNSKSEDYKGVHNLYWAKRIVEQIDWIDEIGSRLSKEDKGILIESILDYKKLSNHQLLLSKLYKNLIEMDFTEEEAAKFIIIGSIDSYKISNFMGYKNLLHENVEQDLDYYRSLKIEKFHLDKAKIVYSAEKDKEGNEIKKRLVSQGFNPEYIENIRIDNLYCAEYLVEKMNVDRLLSKEKKIAIMEQILDLSLLSKSGACKLITVCENLRNNYNIKEEELATILLNVSIDGVKPGIGYKNIVSTKEYMAQIERTDFNYKFSENTVIEAEILKQFRENPEREFYEKKLKELGIAEEKLEKVTEKDLCWTLGLFNSINFKERLGKDLSPNERKIILESLLRRPTDGSTIQGLFEKLNRAGVNNIAETIVNAALGYSGVNGFNYSQIISEDEIRRVLEGNIEKLNTTITRDILNRKVNEQNTKKDNYIEELIDLGVREDFFEKGNPNEKKPKNVYWINKVVNEYDWEKYLGRPISDKEKIMLIERLLAPSNMNINAEVYIGNSINNMYANGIEEDKVCGYLANLAVNGSEIQNVSYTTIFGNSNFLKKFIENKENENFILNEEFFEKLEFENQMDKDTEGEKIYKRMRELGIRNDFLEKNSPQKKYYKTFYFVEKLINEYDFQKEFGRELEPREKVAVIEKMVDADIFNVAKGKLRLDKVYEVIKQLDLKGKDPKGVMLSIGFERIDSGKLKDPNMYYGKIATSTVYAKKVEDYIDLIPDKITERTLMTEVINSKINHPEEVKELYEYYQELGINEEFITKGEKNEKSLENLFMAKKIFDGLEMKFEKEDERLILESILDNNYWNIYRKVTMYKLYNNIEDLGLDKKQTAALFINLTTSKRKKMTYSQLAVDSASTEKLNAIRDELKFEVDEKTLEMLRKAREEKKIAKKVIRGTVDPKRNEKGRQALNELIQTRKRGEENEQPQ